jgi:energy-converting hydrogenase Eha subunit A
MNRNRVLWSVQGLLAVAFLFAAYGKLTTPAEVWAMTPYPAAFMYFISVCEILGALGLILPGVTGIRRELTPLAAAGLAVIAIGATVLTVATMGVSMAVLPAVLGLLAAYVAYGRRDLLTLPQAARLASPAAG